MQLIAMASEAIILISQHMWKVTQPHKSEFQIGKEQRHTSTIPFILICWTHYTTNSLWNVYTVHDNTHSLKESAGVWVLPESTYFIKSNADFTIISIAKYKTQVVWRFVWHKSIQFLLKTKKIIEQLQSDSAPLVISKWCLEYKPNNKSYDTLE